MLKSMTGYARAESINGDSRCVVEIRSVNHRFLEMNIRMPARDAVAERKIREIVSKKISRGHLEISINRNNGNGAKRKLVADEDLVRQFLQAAEKIKSEHSVKGEADLATILSIKDILKYEEDDVDIEERWDMMEKTLKDAVAQLLEMRASEGRALQKDVLEKVGLVEQSTKRILSAREGQEKEIVNKMKAKIEELMGEGEASPERILTEAGISAERSDISEEVIRIQSHLAQIRDFVAAGSPVGRKLEFILQEVNREANTIGSKSALYEISREVVEIKSQLEKIREQAANIE
ncbi:MAG: YicC/YloC family endoribonuclease [Nitrospinota bacterium]